MNKCVGTIFFSIVAFAIPSSAHARSVEQVTTADIRISSDLAVDATYHFEATPPVEVAVRGVAQRRWQVPGNQQVEAIEAFTRKSDGRIIPADPRDFSTQNGILGDAASFVDVKIQQVAFRDLSAGDTTVLTLRTTERDHYIPGQYAQELLCREPAAPRLQDRGPSEALCPLDGLGGSCHRGSMRPCCLDTVGSPGRPR
jgi:hypothetical protein